MGDEVRALVERGGGHRRKWPATVNAESQNFQRRNSARHRGLLRATFRSARALLRPQRHPPALALLRARLGSTRRALHRQSLEPASARRARGCGADRGAGEARRLARVRAGHDRLDERRDGGEQRGAPSRGAGDPGEAWISAIEHPCVIEAARRHFAGRHRLMPVSRAGVLDLDWLRECAHRCEAGAGRADGGEQRNRRAAAVARGARALPGTRACRCFAMRRSGSASCPRRASARATFVSGCAHKFGGPQGVGLSEGAGKLSPAARRRTAGGRSARRNGKCRGRAGDGRRAGGAGARAG